MFNNRLFEIAGVGPLSPWTLGVILSQQFTRRSNHFNAPLGNKPKLQGSAQMTQHQNRKYHLPTNLLHKSPSLTTILHSYHLTFKPVGTINIFQIISFTSVNQCQWPIQQANQKKQNHKILQRAFSVLPFYFRISKLSLTSLFFFSSNIQ